MRATLCGIALAALAATAGSELHAAERGEPRRLRGPLERAWKDATEMMNAALGPEDGSRLVMLAYAAAAGRSCEGVDLDKERYRAAFRAIAEERRAELGEPKKARSVMRRVSYHTGVATGLFLAEHALDPRRFCTGFRESLEDPEFAALFAPASPAPAAAP
jgi:hypothetical protein